MAKLRINAASSPFVNRVVPLTAAGVLVGLAITLTLLNLVLFFLFGGEYRKVRKKVALQEIRIAQLNKEISGRQSELESPEVGNFLGEAQFMDGVLRTKAFSWVDFLSKLEDVKAYGVMFKNISPKVESGAVQIFLRGVANPREEYLKLENNLFASRNFSNVTTFEESKDLNNPWTLFDINVTYVPDPPGTPPPPPPIQAAPPNVEAEAGGAAGNPPAAVPKGTVPPVKPQGLLGVPPEKTPAQAANRPETPAANRPATPAKPPENPVNTPPAARSRKAASPALAPANRPSRLAPGRGGNPPPAGEEGKAQPKGPQGVLESTPGDRPEPRLIQHVKKTHAADLGGER